MKELTKAEEQIMQVLWQLEKAFVKELIEKLPEPKPAYSTVATIVRILQDKGFVGFEAFGKSHRYHPLITKDEYAARYMKNFVGRYFGDSFKRMVSFFVDRDNLSVEDLEEIQKLMKKDSGNQSENNA